MRTEHAAAALGIAGCVAVVVSLALPYVAASGWGAALGQYYAAGPLGVWGLIFFASVGIVVFLAGSRGRTDPTTAAGIELAIGIVGLLIALTWALSTSLDPLFGYPGSWITDHRWVVVAVTAVIPLAAALYARSVVAS